MQETRAEGGILPWIGYEHEEDLKKQILALSQVNINRKLSIKSIEIFFRKTEIFFVVHRKVRIIILIWQRVIQLLYLFLKWMKT